MEDRGEVKFDDYTYEDGIVILIPSEGPEGEGLKYDGGRHGDGPEVENPLADAAGSESPLPVKPKGCCRETLHLLLWDRVTISAMLLMALSAFV